MSNLTCVFLKKTDVVRDFKIDTRHKKTHVVEGILPLLPLASGKVSKRQTSEKTYVAGEYGRRVSFSLVIYEKRHASYPGDVCLF